MAWSTSRMDRDSLWAEGAEMAFTHTSWPLFTTSLAEATLQGKARRQRVLRTSHFLHDSPCGSWLLAKPKASKCCATHLVAASCKH